MPSIPVFLLLQRFKSTAFSANCIQVTGQTQAKKYSNWVNRTGWDAPLYEWYIGANFLLYKTVARLSSVTGFF